MEPQPPTEVITSNKAFRQLPLQGFESMGQLNLPLDLSKALVTSPMATAVASFPPQKMRRIWEDHYLQLP